MNRRRGAGRPGRALGFRALETDPASLEAFREAIGANLERFRAPGVDAALTKYLGRTIEVTGTDSLNAADAQAPVMATDGTGYSFWLFDLDGTLVDVEWSHARSVFDRVGDRLGYTFDDRQVDVLWHGLGGPRNDWLEEWGLEPDAFWEAFHAVEDPETRAAATYLYEDATVVADIDAPVGVVTHCQEYLATAVFDRFGLDSWFDAVVCCDPETGWKPDPGPVELAMDRLGVTPADGGVLVGDGPHDVGAAWNAGLEGVHVERHGPATRRLCVLGDRRIERLTELPVREV